MIQGLLGKKVGMTHVFDERGRAIPVTVIQAGPCVVTYVRTAARDGYDSVQLGFDESKRLSKPELGHLKNLPPMRHLREVPGSPDDDVQVGANVNVDIFSAGETVKVTGTSKGKGFAGVMKRHGFKGGPKTHGQSDRARAPGSIGAGTYPGKVFKGHKMAGRMGGTRVTVGGLRVVQVDAERNLLLVKGAVPGAANGLLLIKKTGRGRR